MAIRHIVDRTGNFIPGVSEPEKEALRTVLGVLSADDGGEDMSRQALDIVVEESLREAGIADPSTLNVAEIAIAGRSIMTWGTRPSPFN